MQQRVFSCETRQSTQKCAIYPKSGRRAFFLIFFQLCVPEEIFCYFWNLEFLERGPDTPSQHQGGVVQTPLHHHPPQCQPASQPSHLCRHIPTSPTDCFLTACPLPGEFHYAYPAETSPRSSSRASTVARPRAPASGKSFRVVRKAQSVVTPALRAASRKSIYAADRWPAWLSPYSNSGPQLRPAIWNYNFGCRFGPPVWSHYLRPISVYTLGLQFGPSISPQFGPTIIWAHNFGCNLRQRFGPTS